MSFFPASDASSTAVIAEEIAAMCTNDNQAVWLARQFSFAYKKWPGVGELRAFFCAAYKPADGIEVGSGVFPDGGIPTRLLGQPPGRKELTAPAMLALPPVSSHEEVTIDPELHKLVSETAAAANMPQPKPRRTIAEIEAELYKGRPKITQADIDALRGSRVTANEDETGTSL